MRIGVTRIDSWKYYLNNEHASLEKVKEDIAGTAIANDDMRAGKAFHKVMENMEPGMAAEKVEQDGFTFCFNGDFIVPVGGVVEASGSKTYEIDGEPVTVRGRCDYMLGNIITDHKMTKKWDDSAYVRFQDAFQWRVYLDMFDCGCFEYRVFLKQWDRRDKSMIHINSMHTVRFHRYPDMQRDIRRDLTGFMRFVRAHMPDFYEKRRNL